MTLYDAQIREPLFEFLEQEYGVIRIIEEKVTGRARADALMVLYDCLCGIEIKSDADTYTRLKNQVKYYDQYFDMNYAVCGTSHAAHIQEHLPAYLGIISVESNGEKPDFYIIRRPLRNPKMKIEKKISLLWRPELSAIQEKYHLPAYTQKSKKFVMEKIIEKIDAQDLCTEISAALLERDYTLIEQQLYEYRKEHQ
jgi:hypothetical protein